MVTDASPNLWPLLTKVRLWLASTDHARQCEMVASAKQEPICSCGFESLQAAIIAAIEARPRTVRAYSPVSSSTIDRVLYDTKEQTMRVTFVSGGRYDYFEVPEEIFDGLSEAPSAGKYLHLCVKSVYRFAKVEDDSPFGVTDEVEV